MPAITLPLFAPFASASPAASRFGRGVAPCLALASISPAPCEAQAANIDGSAHGGGGGGGSGGGGSSAPKGL
jgi:uncharacterized membrane protein YgcG